MRKQDQREAFRNGDGVVQRMLLVWAHMYEMKVPWAFFAESKPLL